MRTDADFACALIGWTVLLVVAVASLVSCAGTSSVRSGDQIDVSGYPAEIRDAYRVFAVKCSRCHTLARPLNARIRDEQHWVRYVTRMRRNPSSGINRKDAEIILDFLLYYTKQVEAEEAEQEAPPSVPNPGVESPAISPQSPRSPVPPEKP